MIKLGKKPKGYNQENLRYLGECMRKIRQPIKGGNIPPMEVELSGLEKALQLLSKESRKKVEQFWGLYGGINHSKKLGIHLDQAFKKLTSEALNALREMFKLIYIVCFDHNARALVKKIAEKVDKGSDEISDLEAVQYLMAFFTFLCNGPKMVFEQNQLEIDTQDSDAMLDALGMLRKSWKTVREIPNNSIKFELLKELLDMLDLNDSNIIKKSMGLPIAKSENIKGLQTFEEIRDFKEKLFPYGPWDVTEVLILGNFEGDVKLEDFMEELNKIKNDWSKIASYATGETMQLRTAHEMRTLEIYSIGGLRFTDIYEVMFLYIAARNLN